MRYAIRELCPGPLGGRSWAWHVVLLVKHSISWAELIMKPTDPRRVIEVGTNEKRAICEFLIVSQRFEFGLSSS